MDKNKIIKTNRNKHLLCIILCFSLCTSIFTKCNKSLDINSTNTAKESLQWKSITDARSSLFGIYGLLRAALADNNGYWAYGELRLGDFVSTERQDLKAIIGNKLMASYSLISDLQDWQRFYKVINAASVFIEHAPQVVKNDPLYSETNMKLDVAQARALRAFTYFYMTRIWGDLPLLTQGYDNGEFPQMEKSSQTKVLNYAEDELLDVVNDLPYAYGTNNQNYYDQSSSYWNGTLFTKISAYAVLAHIAAWESKYSDVDVYTGFILNNYSTSSISYSNVDQISNATSGIFATKSAKQIIAFNFLDAQGESGITGHIEQWTLASPFVVRANPDIYVNKDTIRKVFTDSSDLRFGYDTTAKAYRTPYFTNYSSAIPVFSKIKVVRSGDYNLFGSAIVFTRLEEIILLRAEALAAINRRDDAIDMLNLIRAGSSESTSQGRGLKELNSRDDFNVMDKIFEERRRELMGEGWRWYDQIRYEKLRRNNQQLLELINNKGIYWPIAKEVLKRNHLVAQNDFWQ